MRPLSHLAAIIGAAIIVGCMVPSPARRVYHATVERVVGREGDFYSPAKGRQPLTCVYLRIHDPSPNHPGELMRVWVLDFYAPEIHGKEGDQIVFTYVGKLPLAAGEIYFDSLVAYSVVLRGG